MYFVFPSHTLGWVEILLYWILACSDWGQLGYAFMQLGISMKGLTAFWCFCSDLSYNNFTWRDPKKPACGENMWAYDLFKCSCYVSFWWFHDIFGIYCYLLTRKYYINLYRSSSTSVNLWVIFIVYTQNKNYTYGFFGCYASDMHSIKSLLLILYIFNYAKGK